MSKITAQKAWITRKRNTLIEAYKNAKSAGIKAGIARQFRQEFNLSLKDCLNENQSVTKATKATKPATTKVAFQQKETTLALPKNVQAKINQMEHRIASLESEVKSLKAKVK
jgi:hypothetical protein